MTPDERPWYTKKRYAIPAGVAGLTMAANSFGEPTPITQAPVDMVYLTAEQSGCNPNYSGCLKQSAGDYDCESGSGNGPNYTGPVQVLGYDEFDLDRDNDGWGCE